MSFIRVIQPAPTIPAHFSGLSWFEGEAYIDTITAGTEDDIPMDAVYAALLDDQGVYSEVVLAPVGFMFGAHYAGWDPNTFPRPTLP